MNDAPEALVSFGRLLTQLQPGMTVVVPNDLLLTWFLPARSGSVLDDTVKSAAEAFALRHGCSFVYFALGGQCEEGDGRFHKL